MTTKNNIPAGYKDSAVGIIPQEWEVKQLALLGKIFSGGTPSTDKEEYWGGNIMWCTPSDITSISSKYINNTKDRITAMGLKNSSAILLPINTIIVCTRATIGAAAITQVELSTNQGFKNIKPEKCNTEWLYYSMILNQPKLQRLGCGSTFLEVSKRDFERLKVAVPPMEEQRKIAEILGVWDKAIEKQSRLIEKLELRKRALMQRLLTGRTRLSGFTTPWQKVKLGEIGNFDKGAGVPKEKIVSEGCKAITYGEIYTKYDYVIKDFASYIDSDTAQTSKQISTGAILFAGSGEPLEDIGKCVAFIDNDKAYAGGDIIIFNPSIEVDSLVLSYILNSPVAIAQKRRYGQGHSVVHIYQKDLARIEFELPSLPEQKAIAEVLTTAGKEIATHRKKLDALRLQKRGLMQQLLTGKTRIKI